jgi:hypothetical protein
VRALIKPERLPLKSLKTSSTVRGIGCGIASIHNLYLSTKLDNDNNAVYWVLVEGRKELIRVFGCWLMGILLVPPTPRVPCSLVFVSLS